MPSTRVLSNKRILFALGPATAIANWEKPTLAAATSLKNVSEATRWDGFDINIDASNSGDDRSLTDEAEAQSRAEAQFGGGAAFFTPKPSDTSSILRQTRNIVKTPRVELAALVRTVLKNSVALKAGDEVNIYRVMTDAPRHERGDVSYAYSIQFVSRDDLVVNYILPSATPTAVTLTPSTADTGTVGTVGFMTARYEGRNVTIGATYTSSDPTVIEALPHGAFRRLKVGTATITATYPGSAAGVARSFTVTA